jgi:hypothetical protein
MAEVGWTSGNWYVHAWPTCVALFKKFKAFYAIISFTAHCQTVLSPRVDLRLPYTIAIMAGRETQVDTVLFCAHALASERITRHEPVSGHRYIC